MKAGGKLCLKFAIYTRNGAFLGLHLGLWFYFLCVCVLSFLNGTLHKLKAITFLFWGNNEVSKYRNEEQNVRFVYQGVEPMSFVMFCFPGRNKSNILGTGRIVMETYITAYYWSWCFCYFVFGILRVAVKEKEKGGKSKGLTFLSLCKSPQWHSQTEV